MKKMLGKIGAAVLAVITALSAVPAIPAQAAGDQEETLSFYISLTGSGAEAGENGIFYDDPFGNANSDGVIAVNATASEGDTVVISLELPEALTSVSTIAPVIYTADDTLVLGSVDADVSLRINGEDVEITPSEDGALAWAEPAGDFRHSWKLYGGVNDIGNNYVPKNSFTGATKIEYTITLNSFTVAEKLGPAYEGDALVYIGFLGDESAGDNALVYLGPDNESNNAGITAGNATMKVGDTVTVSLTLPLALPHVHEIYPVIVPLDENTEFAEIDITVGLRIDGSDTVIDYTAGSVAWPEATGDHANAWRLCGGTFENGVQYVEPGLFAGATKIEYVITLNSAFEVLREEPEEIIEPEPEPVVIDDVTPVSDNGTVTPVTPEEPAGDNGLVKGIIVAVIAVIMIIAGILLSKERPPKEEEKKDNGDDSEDNGDSTEESAEESKAGSDDKADSDDKAGSDSEVKPEESKEEKPEESKEEKPDDSKEVKAEESKEEKPEDKAEGSDESKDSDPEDNKSDSSDEESKPEEDAKPEEGGNKNSSSHKKKKKKKHH